MKSSSEHKLELSVVACALGKVDEISTAGFELVKLLVGGGETPVNAYRAVGEILSCAGETMIAASDKMETAKKEGEPS